MHPLKILIVDDEKEFVSTLVERLIFRDFDAQGVFNGKQAVQKVTTETFDVVILDLKMPGMDGIETLRSILEIQPAVKVLLLTGYGSSEISKEGLNAGAFDYIAKPVNITSLIQKMNEAAGR